MEILIRQAALVCGNAAGRLFAQECEIDYPVEFLGRTIRVFVLELDHLKSFRTAKQLFKLKGQLMATKCHDWGQEVVEIIYSVSRYPISIAAKAMSEQSSPPEQPDSRSTVDLGGLGLGSTYLRDGSYQQVEEFMTEMRRRGYIVTVTDMLTNHCLKVNDLQAPDRGGGWKGKDWIGLNFLRLWRDSFEPGQFNYFDQLTKDLLPHDWYIPSWEYLLRAPNGDLRRYWSSYLFVNDYLDVPVRICVSQPKNWELVQPAA